MCVRNSLMFKIEVFGRIRREYFLVKLDDKINFFSVRKIF